MFMYVQHETDGMSQWTAYLRGFHRSIWIVNGVIFILSSLCLIIILKTTLGKKFRTLHIVECGFASIDIISNQCQFLQYAFKKIILLSSQVAQWKENSYHIG